MRLWGPLILVIPGFGIAYRLRPTRKQSNTTIHGGGNSGVVILLSTVRAPDLFVRPSVCRMAIASDDLIWLLVKKNNRFLVKRNGNNTSSITFSSEPNNLYNLNSYKYSGE